MTDKLNIDELHGRGLEEFADAVELGRAFDVVIRAIPPGVHKINVLGIFDDAWAFCEGDRDAVGPKEVLGRA
jgi:hypothetical protein